MAGTTGTKSKSSKRSTKSSSPSIRTPPSSGLGRPTGGSSTSAHGTYPNNPNDPSSSSSYGIGLFMSDNGATLYERLSNQPQAPDVYARIPVYTVEAARAIDGFEDVFHRGS